MSDEIITTVGNTIYFYSKFDNKSCGTLNIKLRELDNKLKSEALMQETPNYEPVIHLRICSYGGSLIACLSNIDTIRSLSCKVHTYVEGGAASAGTLLSVTGHKRFIGKHSVMLIHQLSTIHMGNFEELNDQMKNSTQFMDILKGIYKKYTKITAKELNEILKKDIWFDADKCLQYGLVDEIF